MRAVLSVYDKTGLVALARRLHGAGWELVSSGGTHQALAEAGVPATEVARLTGLPHLLDGRVKTLHPAIHAGILARRDLPAHLRELADHGWAPIDLVVVNLYPFVETVRRPEVSLEEALENIDIGGPTLLRAAAKNFPHVVVLVDPADYEAVGSRLAQGGPEALSLEERRRLALKAFLHVAAYDAAIAAYLGREDNALDTPEVAMGWRKVQDLRYGENPHQRAALLADPMATGGVVNARQLHGPELSYNNLLDADAAWRAVTDFSEPAAVIVKHTNPCGLALHEDQPTAYRRALEGDPVSAYGGIVGFNRPLGRETAEAMRGVFFEVVLAPAFEEGALEVLRRRRRARVLQVAPSQGPLEGLEVRRVSGGALVQTRDDLPEDTASWRVVTKRHPTPEEMEDLAFAWRAVKHVKSNAIVLARDRAIVGMGAGQPNRVTSVHLALRTAGERAQGSVLASDAFFPFADNVEMAGRGGVRAIVQPGGSIRDQESIEKADELGIAMVFTGVRHFRH